MCQTIFKTGVAALCVALAAEFGVFASEANTDDTANKPPADQPELTESVVVRAIRADDEAPVTKTNITHEDLAR